MNHEWMKEKLYALYDGQLPPESHSLVELHLETCTECKAWLDRWEQTSQVFLRPLQAEGSEAFVQTVMRKVRAYGEKTEWVRWPLFARWAFPALAMSVTGFAAALFLTLQPINVSTDALLLGDPQANTSTEWLSSPPSEDQILSTVVANP